MLLKKADDKSKRIALLEELQRSKLLEPDQRKWLREEMIRLSKGIQGEREAAHYLDHYFKDGGNHVLLHDLRFEVDNDVTQIDHLVMNRLGDIFLLETKNYACNLVINEHGEFTVEYDSGRFGIPSPIEQSMRHERVLVKLLERLEIVGRTQKHPNFHHVVMLHPKVTIERPSQKLFDTTNVIKADQFPSWHAAFAEKLGVGTIFKAALNMRSLDTIIDWCEKLKRQHRPANIIALPDFMQPRRTPISTLPELRAQRTNPTSEAKSNIAPKANDQVNLETPSGSVPTPDEAPVKRLICHHCGIKISYPEGKYCWNNAKRFGGMAYCREHQSLI